MKLSQTKRLERLLDRYANGGLDRRTFLSLTAAAAAAMGLSARWVAPALAAVTEVRFDGFGPERDEVVETKRLRPRP